MKVYDLTQKIENEMPLYPGEPMTRIQPVGNGPYLTYDLSFSSHVGTSIDAPSHVLQGEKGIDQYPLERFLLKGRVWNVHGNKVECLSLHDLQTFIERAHPEKGEALLIHTGWDRYWGQDSYFAHPFLSMECARVIVENGFSLVGMDGPNVDFSGGERAPVHDYLLSRDVLIVENLMGLCQLPSTPVFLSILPLKIEGADGSPVRAVAWEEW